MATYYTVVRGDTLTAIAKKYNTTISKLVELNKIKNPDYIVVGQVLTISGNAVVEKTNTTSTATINVFGLQSNTDRTIYATWTWSKTNTEHYQVRWYYDTGDGVWFVGNDSTTTDKQSLYTAPSNAKRVKFIVKPISKKRKVNNKETAYWTASWSTAKIYSISETLPVPPVPGVTVTDYKLTALLSNLDSAIQKVEFEIVQDDNKVFKKGTATVKTSVASYSCTIKDGSNYKVRCRACGKNGRVYSLWSDYSINFSTKPVAITKFDTCRAESETSVLLEWTKYNTDVKYEIEYTTKKEYFEGSNALTSINDIETTSYIITGLETGTEYFFRVRGKNDKGESAWSEISSVVIGTEPSAPTTWSSTTTVVVGEALVLYWIHNTQDGSKQTGAVLELVINGEKQTHTINKSDDEEETSSFTVDTAGYTEGFEIKWRVKTAGVTGSYSPWSVERTVDVYTPPSLGLELTTSTGEVIETLESFPFHIVATAGPNTQTPISYHVTITANESYETVDSVGNVKMVSEGEAVFSKYYNVTDHEINLYMSADSLDLENNIEYTLTCSVSMNSGLTAETSSYFTVGWTDEQYEPNAEIIIDEETFSVSIRPHCENELGELIEGISLSVYRRDFDGGFTELATGIDNTMNTFITDPHPALDYARYRIVAISDATGAVSYYDMPEVPIGGTAVIIQWDEHVSDFSGTEEDSLEQPIISGSMLKLPYNVDVSENYKPDVELIEYIGRDHPVSYYGTQRGVSATWNVSVEKADTETIFKLRRLAQWTGDVYVREPSGSGYWANVTVSFGQKHRDLIIPVTLNVTRVEGGI